MDEVQSREYLSEIFMQLSNELAGYAMSLCLVQVMVDKELSERLSRHIYTFLAKYQIDGNKSGMKPTTFANADPIKMVETYEDIVRTKDWMQLWFDRHFDEDVINFNPHSLDLKDKTELEVLEHKCRSMEIVAVLTAEHIKNNTPPPNLHWMHTRCLQYCAVAGIAIGYWVSQIPIERQSVFGSMKKVVRKEENTRIIGELFEKHNRKKTSTFFKAAEAAGVHRNSAYNHIKWYLNSVN